MWLGSQYLEAEELIKKASGYGFLSGTALVFCSGAISFHLSVVRATTLRNLDLAELQTLGSWWSSGFNAVLSSPALLVPLGLYLVSSFYIWITNTVQNKKEFKQMEEDLKANAKTSKRISHT